MPVLAWILAHPVSFPLILAVGTALMRVVYIILAVITKPFPRLRAIVEGIAALCPDVLRAVVQFVRGITGVDIASPLVDSRDAELARLRAENETLKARTAVLIAADVDRRPN